MWKRDETFTKGLHLREASVHIHVKDGHKEEMCQQNHCCCWKKLERKKIRETQRHRHGHGHAWRERVCEGTNQQSLQFWAMADELGEVRGGKMNITEVESCQVQADGVQGSNKHGFNFPHN